MALTLSERVELASHDGPFQRRVKGALMKHAKYVLQVGSKPEAEERFAQLILNDLSAFAERFTTAMILEPAFDTISSDGEITDELCMNSIPVIWELFTPRNTEAEPVQEGN